MQPQITSLVGDLLEEDMHFVYVGCEDIPHFGHEVENGLHVDTSKPEPSIVARCKEAVAMYPSAKEYVELGFRQQFRSMT